MSFAYADAEAWRVADHPVSHALVVAPHIDSTLLNDIDLIVDVPDPGESAGAALNRVQPDVLLLSAASLDESLAERLADPLNLSLPTLLLVDAASADVAGALLPLSQVRFLPADAKLGEIRLHLRRLARSGTVADNAGWGVERFGLPRDAAPASPPAANDDQMPAVAIRALIKARRARDSHFPPEMFGDPAWDMLLDLAAARLERRRVSVSSLCIAAAVPTTTALRWIKRLCDDGTLLREPDLIDRRRAYVVMSAATERSMTACLRQLANLL